MPLIKIDSVDMPDPSEMKILLSDLDSSDTSRNEQGYLQRDRIRQGVYKLELGWWVITNADMSTLLAAVQPSEISVTFPTESGNKTCTMYVGDRSIEAVKLFGETRWNINFNLIEY